jgi:hypothetical protein
MADWRRIQGRIRKARTSKDPAGELAALYNDTRDAMVAYELATLHEKTGNHTDAAQWYTTAASRFRRAQWKMKAQEALVRLGVETPLPVVEAEALAEQPSGRAIHGTRHAAAAAGAGASSESSSEEEIEATEMNGEPDADTQDGDVAETEDSDELDALPGMQPAQSADGPNGKKKRRRRGRRGGVRHRKRREAAEARKKTVQPQQENPPAAPEPEQPGASEVTTAGEEFIDEPQPTEEQVAAAMAAKHNPQPQRRGRHPRGPRGNFGQQRGQARGPQRGEPRQRPPRHERPQQQARPPQPPRPPQQARPPLRPAPPPRETREETPDTTRIGPAAWQERQEKQRPETSGLRAEPALASRLAKLESQLRRLLASTPHSVDDAATAPAGPGVFVLSDRDLIDNYYVEACQTLRIGAGNLLRGGRVKDGGSLKSLLASYLGIPEAKVTKYLSDHCSVRWLQLDEGAAMLAHFATAVLQPALNILEA